ncbi:uncharacterized protein LOC129219237 isoform X2 [Uloborus diversus]|nr:uncharacterized protein LOC129219237 isoform X2 [Uloborus diversus]XP_054709536.1 uncharacterized protein LOC129219237 isoform X2 [Uloborus diversus]
MNLGLRKTIQKASSPIASTGAAPHSNSTPLKERSLAVSPATVEVVSVIDERKNVAVFEIEECKNTESMLIIYKTLKQQIVNNEAKLRKLKSIENHYSKCKPDVLDQLTQRWRIACQEALRDLHSKMPEPKQDFNIMMRQLQIENELVKYDEENDVFYGNP